MTKYTLSWSYEHFIKRALGHSSKVNEFGNNQIFINLMEAEEGNSLSILPPFNKQMENVKKSISKAFDAFIKKEKSKATIAELLRLQDEMWTADSMDQLLDILNKGLELTHHLKN